MVAIDPRTGDVRALVGGRLYGERYTRGTFNRALQARRQPGSAFKPFVYAAALANGMTPASMVEDEPIDVRLDNGRVWSPGNYEGNYLGETTLRTALAKSANGATVRVGQEVGARRVIAVAQANGIASPLAAVPSLVLGSAEVTPMELVTAYAPFANGGFRVAPRMVSRVRDREGKVLWAREPLRRPVMDARDAFLLTSMLRSVVLEGTGRAVADAGCATRWRARRAPRTAAPTSGSWATRRPSSRASGSATTTRARWGRAPRAGGWPRRRGRTSTSRDGASVPATGRRRPGSCGAASTRTTDTSPTSSARPRGTSGSSRGREPTASCDRHSESYYEPPPDPEDVRVPDEQPPIVDEARKAGKKVEGWFKRVFKF
jgi:hypothetical protein